MKDIVAPVKNVSLLADAGRSLIERGPNIPGIGAIWGGVGLGKTTAATWYANKVDAIFVRAFATWTATSMLATIMRELGAEPLRTCYLMIDFIAGELCESQRPVFVDECNQIATNRRVIETLRDLHDTLDMPLLLIGTEDFRRHLVHRPQLAGRVSQWVEFRRPSLDDAKVMAESLCDVTLAEDLLEDLYQKAGRTLRDITVGLHRIEKVARKQGLATVTLEDWGTRDYTLSSRED